MLPQADGQVAWNTPVTVMVTVVVDDTAVDGTTPFMDAHCAAPARLSAAAAQAAARSALGDSFRAMDTACVRARCPQVQHTR